MATRAHLSIDARLAGSRHAGIGRYESEIISRIIQQQTIAGHDLQWQVWVAADDPLDWLPKELPGNVSLHRTKVRHYSLDEQITWPLQLASVRSDLLWVPHFNVPMLCPTPWVVTLHDLLWHQERDSRATTLPSWKHRIKHVAYQAIVARAARSAEAILVPSKVVAEDVRSRLSPRAPITVTAEGLPSAYLAVGLKRSPQKNPKVLYIGSLYPHKNLHVVLQALRVLPEFTLQVVSARSIFVDQLEKQAKQLGVWKQVEVLGFQTDQQVVELAQKATALIQPSLAEGFGLTGLEGMALGVPVVASDLPVFQEVYGEFATYFPRHDAVVLSETLRKIAKHPPTHTRLAAAQTYARRFSWDTTAQKTWAILEKSWKQRYAK